MAARRSNRDLHRSPQSVPGTRRRRLWLPPTVLVAVALTLPAWSVAAATSVLSLSSSVAQPGDGLIASGRGFPEHDWGQLTLDGSADGMPRFRTADAGSFSAAFDVPALRPGTHEVGAVADGPSPDFDASLPVLATARFDVPGAEASAAATPTPAATPAPTPTATPAATPAPTPTADSSAAPSPAPGSATSAAAVDHVFVVVEENRGYGDVVGNSSAPYIGSLIAGGALATDYHALTHPSLPNYLALTGGSTFGITSDCGPTTCPVSARNLADSLEAAGRTWKSYQEAMPAPCSLSNSGAYAVKHNPFVYYDDVRTDAQRCAAHDVPYSTLGADLATEASTPDFSLIVPDTCHDMHDCSVSTGDAWLARELPRIFASPAWASGRSLLVLTFDEDDRNESNHVLTVFVGPAARSGATSATGYDHYSLLRTVEDLLGVGTLTGNDAGARVMRDLLR